MNREQYEIKRKCDKPKFTIIVCCQGQLFYYDHKTLIGALWEYFKQYSKKNKYHTMNFTLKQIYKGE